MRTLGTLALLLCLAVCISTPPGEGAQDLATPGSGIEALCDGDSCPHHKKSATLVPSFTKTTTATTTTHHTTPPTTTHPANHTTTHPANHTTTHPTNHTTTHPANHTTTHPTNHTTTHRTTPPTTTHPANHTTTHPTNHTTTHPANHTTLHTTPHLTTAAPPVPPDVGVGNYSVWNGSEVCLRVQSGLQIWVRYENLSKAQLWGNFSVQPNQTKVSGNCSDESATMELSFAQGFLHFIFVKNKTQNTVYLHEVRAQLSLQFPGVPPELCPEDRRSSLVPIIIGVVLLILILIIIIAYLLGRRKARGGYQTL
ncbi:macrosialin isoform X2 [Chelonoidis abingdonii]|uniref:macrosialin isoform X2 n=1 Tax=Chelonoidis abingdonii TaxID=106734 RepID=UPI0013F1D47A|nr:macrosialin isoform X2 [Chelonoidis abingdonii]